MNQITWNLNKATRIRYTEKQLADYFRRQLDKGEAIIFTVYGKANIGKSESCMELLREINPDFSIEKDWCNTLERFYEIMEHRQDRYPTKILDDFGPEIAPTKNWDEVARSFMDYMQVVRTERVILFITTQHSKFLNKDMRERLASHYGEIIKKLRKQGVVKAKIQLIQKNIKLDKPYYHNLCINKEGLVNDLNQGKTVKLWDLAKLPDELHKAYKPLRLRLGKDALIKGRSRLNALGTDKTHQEIAEEIYNNLDHYTKTTKKGRKYLNKALIEAEKNLGDRQVKKVIALIEAKLRNNPSFKEPLPNNNQPERPVSA